MPRLPRSITHRAASLLASLSALSGVLPACASQGAPANIHALGRVARDTSSVAIGDGKSVERLFTGRFAGVSVTAAAGGLRIRIQGSGEEPLYVVDGTPLPAGTGEIAFLNSYDIEKIEVLKNPADIGVYGGRGANGVIRITTTRPGRR